MDQENFCEFISSRGILKSCDVHSATPVSGIGHLINYNLANIKYGGTIYVCISALRSFMNYLPNIPVKFILVTGDNDETCPNDLFSSDADFLKFIENDKIIHWFAQNCILLTHPHPKLSQIPIGLDYHTMAAQNHHWGNKTSSLDQEKILKEIKSNAKPFWEREIKCYSNFHFFMGTKFGYDRVDAKAKIPEHLVFYEPVSVNRKSSWETQSRYAYVISPHGNGLDCHRTWEALVLGCIPIVKTSPLDSLYEDLPVLIVNDWSDVTQEVLDTTIEYFKGKEFKYEKLTLKYWMDKINNI